MKYGKSRIIGHGVTTDSMRKISAALTVMNSPKPGG